MSALALCLCDIENQLNDKTNFDENFYSKASEVSRLGSGSACRSIYPEVAVWGQHEDIPGSSDEYAIGIRHQIHPVFKSFHDDILIISAGEKVFRLLPVTILWKATLLLRLDINRQISA